MACAYQPAETGHLQNFLGFVDCQAQTIGEQGYLALSAPGSLGALVLTSALTLLVALVGYRMLLGEVPELRSGVLTLVKIGVVLALATGWQGYRTLVYDVALHSPAELTAAVGAPAGLPGAGGGLVARLDGVDRGFEALAIEGAGPPPDPAVQRVPPPMFGGFDTFAIGAARTVFLIGVMGAFAGLRLLAGLMLALGPIFVAFLLFDSTRGLFAGWLRVLIATALGALATAIALGVELALFEPWLSDLLARRAADQPITGAPAQLLAAAIVFALVLLAMLAGTAWVAWGLRLPQAMTAPLRDRRTLRESRDSNSIARTSTETLCDSRSRAAAIVDAVASTQRRETALAAAGGIGAGIAPSAHSPRQAHAAGQLGTARDESTRRRTAGRVSASARRRDRSA